MPNIKYSMETVDEVIGDKAVEFYRQSQTAEQAVFVWLNPARMHVVTRLSEQRESIDLDQSLDRSPPLLRSAARRERWFERILGRSIPHQSRVERFRAEHCQDYDAAERDRSDPRSDRDHRTEHDERPEQRFHEDIDHRPAADKRDDAIKPRAITQPDDAPRLRCRQHEGKADELQPRHQNAGKKHQSR